MHGAPVRSRTNTLTWVLYDFANSFTQIAFSLYFAQWIVIDHGISDLTFNLAFVAASLALLLTVPVAGFLLDTRLRRITGLRISTASMVLWYTVAAVAALDGSGMVALCAFAAGFYSFLLTFTFYTPLLIDIAPPEKRGRISGFGFAANFTGQIAVLLLALPFATGAISLFGAAPRAETLLPAVIACALFTLPMLVLFKEPRKQTERRPLSAELRALRTAAQSLITAPGLVLFLVAHFLFYDAILTASNNFSIFLEQVWGVPDTIKSLILLGIFVTAAIGSLVAGVVADRVGHLRTFTYVVAGWVLILPFLGLVQDFTLFVIATTLMGFWFGASWTLSRSVFSYIAPENCRNLAFGFFGLVERASSLLGPLVWGLVATGFITYGADRYRFAMLAMAVFVVGAFIVLRTIRDKSVQNVPIEG